MIFFVNSRWVICCRFTWYACTHNNTYIYAYFISFSLQYYMALFYCNSMPYSHIILAGKYYIKNCYCNNSSCHMRITWGTLASYSNNFCSTLKSDITVNYATHKDFLKLPMTHLNAADSPTKLCIEFYSGNTVDLETKGICCSCIPSKDLSNSHTPPYFYCDSEFLASTESSACRSTSSIPYLGQTVLM